MLINHHTCIPLDHDAFCEAMHLDGASLLVSGGFNAQTGAQRVNMPGPIQVSRSQSLCWLSFEYCTSAVDCTF